MKNVGLFISLIVMLNTLTAQSVIGQTGNLNKVSITDAQKTGINFCQNQFEKQELNVKEIKSITNTNGRECIYAINFNEGGFALVSADKRTVPVLAFSDEGAFNLTDIAPATRLWLDKYIEQYELINKKSLSQSDQIKQIWSDYSSNIFPNKGNTRGVEKLVLTKWNQDDPFNYYCPVHSQGPGGHVYAGCVATSMAQIMKYWNYPEHGRGTIEYFWGDYYDVDLDAVTYNWDTMPNTINWQTTEESEHEIAEIIFHCGISVDMAYGYEGSSSSISSAWWAFKQYFKYRPGVYEQDKDTTSNAVWKFKIKQDLDMAQPILYRGTDDEGNGHAFVCDGYQDTSYFHFNWGWSGYNDGYFYLDAIDPQMEFNWSQGALFNLAPNYADYCSSAIFSLPSWSFGDGSGPNYYFNGTDCNWIVAPDLEGIDYIKLTFTKFSLLEGDTLKIYEGFGETPILNLIDNYTASYAPGELTTSGNKFYLEFTTNNQGQADGWEATYETITLEVNDNELDHISIFPNPANNNIFVSGINGDYQMEIYDISGKLIFRSFTKSDNNTDISFLNSGIYFVIITCNDKTAVDKIIKN